MSTSLPLIRIQKFDHSSAQKKSLEAFAEEWQAPQTFWSAASIISSLERPETLMWYAHDQDSFEWTGMTLMRMVGDDAELLYIHTASRVRGRGIGKAMLTHIMTNASFAFTKVFLEVRPSNTAAIALYSSLGFDAAGRRKNYYKDGEDALIFEIAAR